jgi:hypothetical protein
MMMRKLFIEGRAKAWAVHPTMAEPGGHPRAGLEAACHRPVASRAAALA